MSIRQFQAELSKGMPSPVYLLHSTEDFLLFEALTALKGLFSGTPGFDFDVFDMKSPDDIIPVEQVVDILNTMPFLTSRKVVVIQNIQKLAKKDAQKIEDYIHNPADTALLVMLHSGPAPKLFAAAAGGMKTIALAVQEKELPQWIRERAKSKRVSLADSAIEYLIAVSGTDLGMLSSEIEKLECFNSDRALGADDLRSVIYSGAEYSAFDLIDALKRKDAVEVFRIFESVANSQEPQMLLGALNYHYGRRATASGQGVSSTPRLLHEADLAIKTSHRYVIEDLLEKLLKKRSA